MMFEKIEKSTLFSNSSYIPFIIFFPSTFYYCSRKIEDKLFFIALKLLVCFGVRKLDENQYFESVCFVF